MVRAFRRGWPRRRRRQTRWRAPTNPTSASCSRSSTPGRSTASLRATGCTRAARGSSDRCCSGCTPMRATLSSVGVVGRLLDGASQGTVRGAGAAGHGFRGPSVGLGPPGGRRPHPAQGRGLALERRQGSVLRPAATGARRRGALRPHGGQPLPSHDPVQSVATGPRPAVVYVRAARPPGSLRPRRHRSWAAAPRFGAAESDRSTCGSQLANVWPQGTRHVPADRTAAR